MEKTIINPAGNWTFGIKNILPILKKESQFIK